MAQPTEIGDLIQLVVTYTAPSDTPTAVVTSARMLTRSPSGVVATVNGNALAPNVWKFVAASRINESGSWTVRVNADAGLIDSIELSLPISPTAFPTPV